MTLFPGSFDDPIIVSIQNRTLTETQVPSFEALSYAWGNASDLQDILIQGKPMSVAKGKKMKSFSSRWTTLSVTSNLSQALRYIRYKDQPRILWADAVCVDQQNLDERGKQVMRMPEIYTLAKGVIAWLGPESSNSALAMKTIVDIGSGVVIDFKRRTLYLECSFYGSIEQFRESLQLDKEVYPALRDLISRSWFERLWILQELYLGRGRIHMLCGFERTSWQQFCGALLVLQSCNASDPDKLGQRLAHVATTIKYKESGGPYTLTNLLPITRHLQCSDPRDKVYAILNFASDESSDIQPDYSMSTSEVFRTVVEHSLSKFKSLKVLSECSLRERKLSMPTWVPDWSVQSQCERTIDTSCVVFPTKAYANFISSDILCTLGVHVTTLHEFTNDFPHEIPGTANELAGLVRKLVSATDDSGPEMTTQSRIESLCRTLCCNSFAEKWHPPRDEFPSFPELIRHVINSYECLLDSQQEPSEVCSLYARWANKMMFGRRLVMMANGLFGLVPEGTRPGDIICVLLGCGVPLVLRPDEGPTFKVVGECYADGAMSGEPLLGELPNNWSPVSGLPPDSLESCGVFLNTNTGRLQKEDPRLTEPLPMGWRMKSHYREDFWSWYVNDLRGEDSFYDPRMEPTALREQRGVDVREFRLI